MYKKLLEYSQKEKLFTPNDKVLLAVSGGVDSMVMVDLFNKANVSFGIAHCNFHLRADESDGDEQLVKRIAQELNIECFVNHFQTESYAQNQQLSIQEAARELRYSWFYELAATNGYRFIATAHHRDDAIETFLINLIRGTGIHGLTGIPAKTNNIIRPMLFVGRAEITAYALANNIDYREDSSNRDIKYLRNKIRNKLIPMFEDISPSFRQTMNNNLHHLIESSLVIKEAMNGIRERVIEREQNDFLYLSIEKIKQYSYAKAILFDILNEYGFNNSMIDDIAKSMDSSSGKTFISSSHKLFRDRDYFILVPVETNYFEELVYIENETINIEKPYSISIERISNKDFIIPKENHIAALDAEKLVQPLFIRRWRPGDYFQPLGMNGMKKVSDYLIDKKVPIPLKEQTWVLASGEKIAWLMGYRLDDRFKITENTQNIICFTMKRP